MLADHGPSAIKARSVAELAGTSATTLYYHLGGIPELLAAVAREGFAALERSFAQMSATDDPVADLMAMASACRGHAQGNPHLYDLMFGLSTRGSYRPNRPISAVTDVHPFHSAYQLCVDAGHRLIGSGRIRAQDDAELLIAQLWSAVHGFIELELAGNFSDYDDPLVDVLLELTVNVMVGFGDSRESALRSGLDGVARYRVWESRV
ncbi:TetR/AcrR family transcriptional regulator [Gordonia polyisoprenivorans]|nr:TetR-like C-terminal domain-containing protein [Gordonia polyisoprenivorans]QTI71289.1 TetR/AcrR family transcriptional regulator [Gordonia polyisoprenivorans]